MSVDFEKYRKLSKYHKDETLEKVMNPKKSLPTKNEAKEKKNTPKETKNPPKSKKPTPKGNTRHKLTESAKERLDKESATNTIPQLMTGATYAVANNSPFGIAYSIATGKKLVEPTENDKKYGLDKSGAYKVGNVLGTMASYATPYKLGEKAIAKGASKVLGAKGAKEIVEKVIGSKVGQKVGEKAVRGVTEGLVKNTIGDATIGTVMNLGMSRGEGLEGKDLAKDMAINAGLDFAIGGAIEALPAVKGAIKNATPKGRAKLVEEQLSDSLSRYDKYVDGISTKKVDLTTKRPIEPKLTPKAENTKVETVDSKVDFTPKVDEVKVEKPKAYNKSSKQEAKDLKETIRKTISADGYENDDLVTAELEEYVKMAREGKVTMEDKIDVIDSLLSNGVVDYNAVMKSEGNQIISDARNWIRKAVLTIPDEVKKNITDWNEFRKSNIGRFTLKNKTNGGQQIDAFYDELRNEFNGMFPDVNTPEEMLQVLSEFMDRTKNVGGKDISNIVDLMDNVEKENLFKELSDILDIGEKPVIEGAYYPKSQKEADEIIEQARNGLLKSDEIHTDQTLKPNGADVNRMGTTQKESKAYANEWLPDEEKYRYETETHKGRNKRAEERLQVDYEGEYQELKNKEHYTSEDFATTARLASEETAKGNIKRVNELTYELAKHSSEKGQEFEAIKHIKQDTPEGMLYQGQLNSIHAVKKLKDKNPKLFEKTQEIINDVDQIAKDVSNGKLTKEEAKKSLEDVAKANKLKKPLFDKVLEQIQNGEYDKSSIAEAINVSKGVPILTSEKADKIIEYMKKYEEATNDYDKRAWKNKAQQIVADAEGSSLHEKFRSLQRIGMLFNPKTLITRNAGGNALFESVDNISSIPASLIDRIVALKTGERTTQGLTLKKMKAQAEGFAKGVSEQIKDIKNGVDTTTSRTAYELPGKTIWDSSKSKTTIGKIVTETVNFFDKATNKLLQFGDRPFYEAQYKSRKVELEDLISKGQKSAMTEEEIHADCMAYALDKVFQGDTNIAKRASKIRNALGYFGDIAIPFTQTPSNILDKLMDYSPVGLVRATIELGKTSKGTFNQKKFVDTLGRTFTGGGIIALGAVLANKGILTTETYDSTKYDLSKALSAKGVQANSLYLDGSYYSIDWASPVGQLLLLGAEIGNTTAKSQDIVGAIYDTARVGVNSFFSQSYLQGVMELFSSKSPFDSVGKTMLNAPTQFLPSALRLTAKVVDPVRRETYDSNAFKEAGNKIIAQIPFLSKTLPEKKGVDGESIMQYQGRSAGKRAFESYLTPYNKSEEQSDPIQNELLRLYESTGTQSVLLNSARNNFEYNGEKFYIKNAEEYSNMQEDMGKKAMNDLKKLLASSEYKKMSDWDKANAVSNIQKDAHKYAKEQHLIRTGQKTKKEIAFGNLTDAKQKTVTEFGTDPEKALGAIEVGKTLNTSNKYAKATVIAKNYDANTMRSIGYSDRQILYGQLLSESGVDPKKIDSYYEKAKSYDPKTKSTGVSQHEAEAVLRNDKSLTEKQRYALYGAIYTSKSKKGNPFKW